MRHVDRLPKPDILEKKHDEWLEKYMKKRESNPSARPDSSKYGNPSIKKCLHSSSFGKCFYCETKLNETSIEIDHCKEVHIFPELAYTWDNLYMSCSNCNDKMDCQAIPIEEVLDPCKDSDEEIQANITFEDECIYSQPNSEKGMKTIQKFRLNTDSLDLRRSRWLRQIANEALEIRGRMIKEERKVETEEEKRRLLRYTQPDQPYSLMSEIYLRKRMRHLFD